MNTSDLKFRIFDAANNSTCWAKEYTANLAENSGAQVFGSVGSNTCAGVPYTNATNNNNPYGAYVQWPGYCSDEYDEGSNSFHLKVTPPGQSSFTFTHGFSWYC